MHIEKRLFKGKIIILYGARQVGKTTLIKNIQKKFIKKSLYLNCDEPDIRFNLTNKTSSELKAFFGNKNLIIIDEAQRVENIGLTLKLIIDNYPNIQILATGSSSFELSNKIIEPLTGRHYEFHLYPFSIKELYDHQSKIEIQRLLERRIIYGMYPEVVTHDGQEAETIIKNLANNYLYKDILIFQNIRNFEILTKLLQALALQIGNEVSYAEIGNTLGIDKNTVFRYIDILEKAFVIFKLPPFSKNLRNELKKLRKIYFYDTGIRNALINNLNPLSLRQDKGALFENFMISEILKKNSNRLTDINKYFWRTHAGQEIDYLEEAQGKMDGLEFKWKKGKYKIPKAFQNSYPDVNVTCVNHENFQDILT